MCKRYFKRLAEVPEVNVIPESHKLDLLRSYFDGSGKQGAHNPKSISLAGFCGKSDEWTEFEDAWENSLIERGAPKTEWGKLYWHSREAFHRTKGYDGWTAIQAWELAVSLMKVVHAHSTMSITRFGVTVDLEDFRRFKADNPKVELTPKNIMLDFCIFAVCGEFKKLGIEKPSIEWIFDDGEEFEPVFRKAIQLGHPIRTITQGIQVKRAQQLYPLQACDLLAWSLNRYDSRKPKFNWYQIAAGFFAMGPFLYTHYDLRRLIEALDENGNYRTPLNIKCSGFWGMLDMMEYWLEVFGKKEK